MSLIRIFIIIFVFSISLFNSTDCLAFSKDIYGKEPTEVKKRYCLALTKHYTNRAIIMNRRFDDYRGGIGINQLHPNKWKLMKISEPFFWSEKLTIFYSQETKGRNEEFLHKTACVWDGRSFYFNIWEDELGYLTVCTRFFSLRYTFKESQRCPRILGF